VPPLQRGYEFLLSKIIYRPRRSYVAVGVTAMLGIGALGTIIGGMLADRLGQRQVLLGSLFLSLPALYIFLLFPGPWAILTGAAHGIQVDM
jgi:FSR family fosmidomycin resistance protein-like MFS transporter